MDAVAPPLDLPAALARVAMLESQVRHLQAERITHLQQIRTLLDVTERLDKRFAKVLAELAELRASSAESARADVALLLKQAPPTPPPTPAPKPPSMSHERKGEKDQKRHAHGRNTQAPPGLVVDEVDVGVDVCAGCGSDDLRVRETLERRAWHYIRGHLRQRVERCRTVSCNRCLKRTTAQGTPRPFPHASCTTEMLVHVGYGKCGLFLPLERQLGELRRQGLPVSQSTLVDWHAALGAIAAPVVACLWQDLVDGDVLTFDGTGLKVQRKGGGKTHHGHIYVFARPDTVVYRYLATKHGERLEATLSAFGGTAVADAESANNAVFASGERVEAGCNAHAFQKFRGALEHDVQTASEGMAWLAAMFREEGEGKQRGLTGAALLDWRRRRIGPIVAQFREWLEAKAADVLPESSVGKAIRYYRRQWPNLTRFMTDADVPIDNNDSERALKLAALLRKNSLFAGSPEAAQDLAELLSLIETCRRQGVDAEQYLVWMVDQRAQRRGTPTESKVDDLTPHAYRRDGRVDAPARAPA
jgi:transposase